MNYFLAQKLINRTKTGETLLGLYVIEVVLVKCNLTENQYQHKSEVLYTFIPNSSYADLLNVEPSTLVSLKTYNFRFDDIKLTFADPNLKPFEVENKVNLTLFTNKKK